MRWKDVWAADKTGEIPAEIRAIDEVNGSYEVLVKVRLLGKAAAADARLLRISFETVTMLNSKTQPGLRLGRNLVYVGAGDPTESTVLWPDLEGRGYKPYAVDEKNVKTAPSHPGYMGTMFAEKGREEAYVVFKLDAPRPIRRITYGGRLYNRGQNAHIDFLHSFDGGKTWTQSYSLTDTNKPWDVIHYERVDNVPAGARSVLFKYRWNAYNAGSNECSLYAVRMEADYPPEDVSFKPLDVTFTWKERQEDYSLVTRSHRQRVEKLPFTYTIDVGGADHPAVESLRLRLADGEAVRGPRQVRLLRRQGRRRREVPRPLGELRQEPGGGQALYLLGALPQRLGGRRSRRQDPHRRHRGFTLYGRRRLPVSARSGTRATSRS